MFMIFAGSRILFANSLRSINDESVFFSALTKNNSEIIAATPKTIRVGKTVAAAALIVCVSCNATRNEIIVIDSVIAPIISMVDLLFLPMLLLLVLMLSETRISFLTWINLQQNSVFLSEMGADSS